MRIPSFALFCIAVVAACSFPTETCGCSPPPPPLAMALAFGTITDTDGSPVAGALVNAAGTRGSCPGNGQRVASAYGSQPSDSSGRYRVYVGALFPISDTVCVQFSARRSVAVTSDSVLVPLATVFLRDMPYDSIRVDFRFP